MSDWKEYYKNHLYTAEEAVKAIKSGDRVVIGHACGEPSYLVDAMVANAASYKHVEIVHMVSMGSSPYCNPEYVENFWHNAIFLGGSTRKAIQESRGDFTTTFFFEVPKLFRTSMPVDVALCTVTPPDENGMCSLGVSVDYTYEAVQQAKVVIAQVNKEMPYTGPMSLVPVEKITHFVEYDKPLIELPPAKLGEVEIAIGEHCAELVKDGDTLQLGIGAIPDAVLAALGDKHDLGIHSEMFSDGVVNLVEKGVINNSKKTLNPGKFVANFLMGTRRLYDFVDHNPDVIVAPVDYVNNPFIAYQNDNLVSINSAVQCDLLGQVNAESIGLKQISGVGGQVDFIRAASYSKGGRAIIAMPSTNKGKSSKIVAMLDAGSAVTTSRNDVDYVVTEYGIAHLKGETLRQRARNLIEIAHPDFRDELKAEFEKRFNTAY